jgi:hypothetical protein
MFKNMNGQPHLNVVLGCICRIRIVSRTLSKLKKISSLPCLQQALREGLGMGVHVELKTGKPIAYRHHAFLS